MLTTHRRSGGNLDFFFYKHSRDPNERLSGTPIEVIATAGAYFFLYGQISYASKKSLAELTPWLEDHEQFFDHVPGLSVHVRLLVSHITPLFLVPWTGERYISSQD